MAKEYVTFSDVDHPKDLPDNTELELFIKDLTPDDHKYKYDTRYVRAVISRDKSVGPDTLWFRFRFGVPHPKPYSMQITEELGEVPPVRHGRPEGSSPDRL